MLKKGGFKMRGKRKNFLALLLSIVMVINMINIPIGAGIVYAEDSGENVCTVTFTTEIGNFSNESQTITVQVAYNSTVEEVLSPYEENYCFVNWVDEAGDYYSSEDIANMIITEDKTFSAVMELLPEYVNYTFNAGDGYFDGDNSKHTVELVDSVQKGEPCNTEIESPVHPDGKAFVGWVASTDPNQTILTAYQIAWDFTSEEDVVFTAVWTDGVRFTFYKNEGDTTPYAEWVVPKGETANKDLTNPISDNDMAFSGWKTIDDEIIYSSQEVGYKYVTDNDVVFVAQWEEAYSVTFYPNGGYFNFDTEDIAPKTIYVGKNKKIEDFPSISKDGFIEWGYHYYGTDESADVDLFSEITSNMEVELDWIEAVDVTVDANGGTFSSYGSDKYMITVPKGVEGALCLEQPVKDEDNIFAGWSINDKDGEAVSDEYIASYKVTEPITVYATWTSNYFTLVFNANGGTIDVYGEQLAEYTVKVAPGKGFGDQLYAFKDGCTFRGWKVQEEDEIYSGMNISSYKPSGTPPRTINISAEWVEGGDYTYYLNSNFPEGVSLKEIEETYEHQDSFYGSSFTEIPYTVGKYVLSGWGYSRDTEVGGPGYIPLKDKVTLDRDKITFYAVWQEACKVTIKADGGKFYTGPGSESAKDYVEYVGKGSSYKLEKAPIMDDNSKVVTGFKIEGDTSGKVYKKNEFVTINDDVVFVPVWEKPSTTVKLTFLANGGIFTKNNISIGNTLVETLPLDSHVKNSSYYQEFLGNVLKPVRDGYTFLGWGLGAGNTYRTTKEIGNEYIRSELTLKAFWQKNKSNPVSKKTQKSNYSNEWIKGKWYNEDGTQTYSAIGAWKSNGSGWWYEDSSGWYPNSKWQRIDGKWYYFKPDGYMASNEYYNGYWFNSDGSWDSQYYLKWKSNSKGWWVEDKSGWWPSSRWLKIDGNWYYFDSSGYMATNTRVDGYWIGANGVCQ